MSRTAATGPTACDGESFVSGVSFLVQTRPPRTPHAPELIVSPTPLRPQLPPSTTSRSTLLQSRHCYKIRGNKCEAVLARSLVHISRHVFLSSFFFLLFTC